MEKLSRPPSVDRLSRDFRLQSFPERVRVRAARAAVAGIREGEYDDFAAAAERHAWALVAPSLAQAINLTGIVLHTGLGRARLAPSVAARVAEVASGHSAVEFDLESGQRGDRQTHVRDLLCELTGAEDALVVNNCAAAVVLGLSALAAGREVILSRGEMVEIGGAFRMPEIVRQSGCRLVEVGCTNKTRLSDYAEAIGPETAALLRCHPSNFRIIGFTSSPEPTELASLAHEHGVRMIDDAGSGCLINTLHFGLPKERTLGEAVADGADLVMASGDKLLGGPQAGLLIGEKRAVQAAKRHPLARAFRVDKLTLAGLEATLRLYRDGRELEIPTWRYLARPVEEVRSIAARLAGASPFPTELVASHTETGGGSIPGRGIETVCLDLLVSDPAAILTRLRSHRPAVIGRTEDGRVRLDPRTLDEEEIPVVEAALRGLA